MKKIFLIIIALGIQHCLWAQETLSLSQQQCREMALSANEDLQKSDNAAKQAELNKKIANSAFLPGIDGFATGMYMLPDQDLSSMVGMQAELLMHGMYMAGFTLMQPLYTGGKILAGHSLAKIGIEAAAEQKRLAEMQVIQEADNAYWSYIAVLQKVDMMKSYMAQMDTIYRQTTTAVRIGMATESDVLRVESHRSNLQYNMQRVLNGADLCRMALCREIGVATDTQIVPTDTEIEIPLLSEMSDDVTQRPEIQLLQKQVDAGKYQERMARADMLPMLGLAVEYFYYGNIKIKGVATGTTTLPDGSPYDYSQPFTKKINDDLGIAMLALRVPICHWGSSWHKVQKVQLDTKNAELDLQKNTQLINLEVQQAIKNVQDSYMLAQSAKMALEQAEENLRVTQRRYSSSMATLTDLLDAQSQWQQAKSNLIEAQTQYKIYETAYQKAVGQLQ